MCFQASSQSSIGFATGAYYGILSNYTAEYDNTTNNIEENYFTGMQLKATFEFELSKNLAFQPEITLIQKGIKAHISNENNFSSSEEDLIIKINYLQIPLLLKVKFGGKIKGYLAFGPNLGIALGGKIKENGTYQYDSFPAETYEDESPLSFSNDEETVASFKKVDLSILGKVGMTYPLGKGAFFGDIGYDYGFSNLRKEDDDNDDDFDPINNRGFVLSVGYAFRLAE